MQLCSGRDDFGAGSAADRAGNEVVPSAELIGGRGDSGKSMPNAPLAVPVALEAVNKRMECR